MRAYFERYRQARDNLDTETLRSMFAETFLNFDVHGSFTLDREAMLELLPRPQAISRAIAATGLELQDLTELPLDDLHTLVHSSWTVRYGPNAHRDTASQSGHPSCSDTAIAGGSSSPTSNTDIGLLVLCHLPEIDPKLQ